MHSHNLSLIKGGSGFWVNAQHIFCQGGDSLCKKNVQDAEHSPVYMFPDSTKSETDAQQQQQKQQQRSIKAS